MSNVARLREEHAELVKIASQLSALVDQPTPPPQVELFALRRQLSSTLIAHLKAEDWVLYPRLMGSGNAEVAATAQAFNDEMGGLASTYLAYSDKWNAGAIASDWPGYCAETKTIIAALTDRITRENRELYPLLDTLDRAA